MFLRTARVQTYLTQKAANYLSKQLNAEVSVGGVDISFFLDLVIEDVKVYDLHDNELLVVEKLLVDVGRISLRRNTVIVKNISLKKALFALRVYEGEEDSNVQFIVNYFSSEKEKDKKKSRLQLELKDLTLSDTRFIYENNNKEHIERGLDFSNLDIAEINLKMTNVGIYGDTISAFINTLSCVDKSGFRLNQLSGMAQVSSSFLQIDKLLIETERSQINMDLRFDYDSYAAYRDFIEAVSMDAVFNMTRLNLEDIAYFAPAMFGLDNVLIVDGVFRGTVSNLRGRDIKLKYAKNTYFSGDFRMSGLPDIENTFINFNAQTLRTTIAEINTFSLPSEDEPAHIKLPEELLRLGFVNFNGNFTGFIDDFVADGVFRTDLGVIKSDLLLKRDDRQNLSYKGYLAAENFHLGKILNLESQLGQITCGFELNGAGLNLDNADVTMNGNISSIVYNDYNYRNIKINGDFLRKKFSGYIEISEENIDMDFQGIVDFSRDKPIFDFSSELKYIKLDKLNITDAEVPRTFSAYLKCRFNGSNLEDIGGIFIISDISFIQDDKELVVNELHITNAAREHDYKNIVLNSELLDIFVEGNFKYTDLAGSINGMINNYLPSYKKDSIFEKDPLNNTQFRYDVKLKNAQPLTDFFAPAINISNDFYIYGNFDYTHDIFTADAASDFIFINDMFLQTFYLKIEPREKVLRLRIGASEFKINSDMLIEDLVLLSQSKDDSILFDLKWMNKARNIRNSGDINGYFSFEDLPQVELKFLKGRVYINDSLWVVSPRNQILFDTTSITINDLIFRHNRQMLMINGVLSHEPDNQLDVVFDNFDISDFNPLIKNQGLTLEGMMTGKASFFDVYKSFGFLSDLRIENFGLNDDRLGNLVLNSNWDRANNRIVLNTEIIYVGSIGENIPFTASGYFYPGNEEDQFDITAQFENFRLKLIEKYLASFSSDVRGFATGTVNIKGNAAQPEINGSLFLRRAGLKVDYLNTMFNFAHEIKIENNAIKFDNMVLNDVHGGQAVLNGGIFHKKFKDFVLDLNFRMQNLMCLNTTAVHNDMFYGTAFATGTTRIHGPVENITMDIFAKTERNTRVFLPLEGAGEISENNFITFVSHDTLEIDESIQIADYGIDMTLNFDLEVTPDAEVQIIFDSQIGDIIRARGNGNLKMEITMLGDFRMFGDYVIEDGDYLFTLQNIINKRFKIDRGSQIIWSGDPFNAQAQINAVYPLRVPLYDLFIASADTSQEYRKRVPVNCLLGMSGNLFNPEISFDIDLPMSDENTKNQLRSIINTDAEMNRQMFALLALNRFLPPQGLNEFSNVGISTGLEATSTELLSNQLSNWLSQISSDVDIGVNYRAGDELTSDEVELALSTQLFNDRVNVDGSVGTSATGQNTSQLVGDVNVELKLTDDGKFRMKFYNKSNAFDMIKHTAPYTQGVGFFYRREFDSFNELLRIRPKKHLK